MATAFEAFIQLELPKRPYLETDVSTESVIVRRGAGPRQLNAVSLSDGQVLGKVGGVLTGITPTTGIESVTHTEAVAATTWTITHNKGNKNALVQLRDEADAAVFADTITFNDNDIVVTFSTAQAGVACIVFV